MLTSSYIICIWGRVELTIGYNLNCKVNRPNLGHGPNLSHFEQNGKLCRGSCHLSTEHGMEYIVRSCSISKTACAILKF